MRIQTFRREPPAASFADVVDAVEGMGAGTLLLLLLAYCALDVEIKKPADLAAFFLLLYQLQKFQKSQKSEQNNKPRITTF